MTTGGKAHPVVAPPWVFYGHPFAPKGLWLRADLCTAQVDCPHCEVKRWEPCKRIRLGKRLPGSTLQDPKYERLVGGYTSGSCHHRRKAARDIPSSGLEITVRAAGDDAPPSGGYRVSVALPPSVQPEEEP